MHLEARRHRPRASARWGLTRMEINHPDVKAEVEAAFARYEAALVSNDVDTLQALFWHSRTRSAMGSVKSCTAATRSRRFARRDRRSGWRGSCRAP